MNKWPVLFFLVLIGGCGRTEMSPDLEKGLLEKQVLNEGGVERNYHVYIPENPMNAAVVLLFHGNGGNYDDLLGLTGGRSPYKVWLDIAQEEDLILLVPNGTLGSNDRRGWNDCRSDALTNPTVDDREFISNLLDFIQREYDSDASKVYAVGTSNGGHFAIRLAQEIPERLTAFAAVVAANPVHSKCVTTSSAVSALFMNGTEDPFLPYGGGEMAANRGEVLSADQTVLYWVGRNATDTIPEKTDLTDSDASDNSSVTKSLYKNGTNGTEVALYDVSSGGHAEPSIAERYRNVFLLLVGNQNGDMEMADEVWDFFKTKTK